MPTGEGTPGDARLISQLARRGVDVTVRKLQERRRMGIIESPEIVRHGRRGTEALDYPPGTAERLEEIDRMLKEHRDMDAVVLGLFGIGVNPTETALRDAYKGFLDRSEADDLKNLALADADDEAFGKKVYKFASKMREELPEVVDRWNADSMARAREQRRQTDRGTGEPVPASSRDVRNRDAESWLSARIGEPGGDAKPMMRAFGFREDMVDEMDADGGTPTYADLRDALDTATYDELVTFRDLVRGSMVEFFTETLPESIASSLANRVDTPDVVGMMVAAGVLSTLVYRTRHEGEDDSSE